MTSRPTPPNLLYLPPKNKALCFGLLNRWFPLTGAEFLDPKKSGAGPAGIQLGHFLKHSQRDYVIFERRGFDGLVVCRCHTCR